jgi:hypothetical protein
MLEPAQQHQHLAFANGRVRLGSTDWCPASSTPSGLAIAERSTPKSAMALNSTKWTPSGNRFSNRMAVSAAGRVLPDPPAPVSVRIRTPGSDTRWQPGATPSSRQPRWRRPSRPAIATIGWSMASNSAGRSGGAGTRELRPAQARATPRRVCGPSSQAELRVVQQ